MPKVVPIMSVRAVDAIKHPAPGEGKNHTVAVGGVPGLMLQITPGGARSWVLRTMIGVKRREMGLGPCSIIGLKDAREAATIALREIRLGVDPIETRRAARVAAKTGTTFADAVDDFLKAKSSEFSNEKHRKQWRATLDNYAIPTLGEKAFDTISVNDVRTVLEPIWTDKNETASRLRQRIEKVLAFAATTAGREGYANPAGWRGNLDNLLARPGKVKKVDHQPAVQVGEMRSFWQALRKREGTAAQALAFAILCASRSGEVRGATWDEIDMKRAEWTIPAARMKMKREHVVPLSPTTVDILKAMQTDKATGLVFPAPRGGLLSDMTLSAVMRRMHDDETKEGRAGWLDKRTARPAVPHGFRSTFKDWAGDHTEFAREIVELSLAHQFGDNTENAYRRSAMLEKRRPLMTTWAEWLVS